MKQKHFDARTGLELPPGQLGQGPLPPVSGVGKMSGSSTMPPMPGQAAPPAPMPPIPMAVPPSSSSTGGGGGGTMPPQPMGKTDSAIGSHMDAQGTQAKTRVQHPASMSRIEMFGGTESPSSPPHQAEEHSTGHMFEAPPEKKAPQPGAAPKGGSSGPKPKPVKQAKPPAEKAPKQAGSSNPFKKHTDAYPGAGSKSSYKDQ